MRIALTVPLLLMPLAGCQVEQDRGNDQVTIQYNAEVAENAVEDVTNEAARIGGAIVNDVEREAGRAQVEGDQQGQTDTTANAN